VRPETVARTRSPREKTVDRTRRTAFTNPTHANLGGYLGLGFGIILNDD
jgi:hypothetical protein